MFPNKNIEIGQLYLLTKYQADLPKIAAQVTAFLFLYAFL